MTRAKLDESIVAGATFSSPISLMDWTLEENIALGQRKLREILHQTGLVFKGTKHSSNNPVRW